MAIPYPSSECKYPELSHLYRPVLHMRGMYHDDPKLPPEDWDVVRCDACAGYHWIRMD